MLQPLRKEASFRTKVFNIKAGVANCPASCRFLKDGTCFALNGPCNFRTVKAVHQANSDRTRMGRWLLDMITEVARSRAQCIRPHGTGEFWSIDYMQAWLHIAASNPNKQFYAYTKRIAWAKQCERDGIVPANWTFIFSSGSDEDYLIDKTVDRHTEYFSTEADLLAAGYINASGDDSLAWRAPTNKIGLLLL